MVVEKAIGGKPVFLSYLPAGSYVGEMALLEGGRRTATVRATTDGPVEVMTLDAEAFHSMMSTSDATREDLNRIIQERLAREPGLR
jgi:CRP-like cAMP-binding protein